jgi:hypothetical protein
LFHPLTTTVYQIIYILQPKKHYLKVDDGKREELAKTPIHDKINWRIYMKYKIETTDITEEFIKNIISDLKGLNEDKLYYNKKGDVVASVRLVKRKELSNTKLGRPSKDFTEEITNVKNLIAANLQDNQIYSQLGISRAKYYQIKKKISNMD